jgi:hypothetical protein
VKFLAACEPEWFGTRLHVLADVHVLAGVHVFVFGHVLADSLEEFGRRRLVCSLRALLQEFWREQNNGNIGTATFEPNFGTAFWFWD